MNDDAVLVKLDKAQQALAECKCAMDAKKIRDAAESVRVYLERSNASVEIVNRATEIRLLAQWQMGEFLKAMPKAIGGNPKLTPVSMTVVGPPTLKEIGITYLQSSRAQKLADIPAPEFHERIAVAKASGGRLTTGAVLNMKSVMTKSMKQAASMPKRDVRKDGKRKAVVREIKSPRDGVVARKALWRISTVAGQADAISEVIREVNMESAFCLMTRADADEFIRQFTNAKKAISEIINIMNQHKYEEKSIPIQAD